MNVPIVVVAYNRPDSLLRLLGSINRAKYPKNVQLIISIDKSDTKEVESISKNFNWHHGKKEIILHKEHIGLKKHILFAGDLSVEFDGVIILEDDLYVSPCFYDYTCSAIEFYNNDCNIAGISLYSHSFNETAALPFTPLIDSSDVFFMQIPSSWGQCWTTHQWKQFRQWYELNMDKKITADTGIPPNVANWPKTSWKKYFLSYMVETNKFFLYPRFSLTTNFGEPGLHFPHKIHLVQVPLLSKNRPFAFKSLKNSFAIYDSFCEALPGIINHFQPHLKQYDYSVDLYGVKTKHHIKSEYVLTCKQTTEPIYSFAMDLKPVESNIIYNIIGDDLFFAKYSKCNTEIKTFNLFDKRLLYYYSFHKYQIEPIHKLKTSLAESKKTIRNKEIIIDKLEKQIHALENKH